MNIRVLSDRNLKLSQISQFLDLNKILKNEIEERRKKLMISQIKDKLKKNLKRIEYLGEISPLNHKRKRNNNNNSITNYKIFKTENMNNMNNLNNIKVINIEKHKNIESKRSISNIKNLINKTSNTFNKLKIVNFDQTLEAVKRIRLGRTFIKYQNQYESKNEIKNIENLKTIENYKEEKNYHSENKKSDYINNSYKRIKIEELKRQKKIQEFILKNIIIPKKKEKKEIEKKEEIINPFQSYKEELLKKTIERLDKEKMKRDMKELIKKQKEEIKHQKELEELNKKKEIEKFEMQTERIKRIKLRKKLDLIVKKQEKKKIKKLMKVSLEISKKKLEVKEEIESKRQLMEKMKKIKEEEEENLKKEKEDKINIFIEELKIRLNEEKEIELKEEENLDEDSNHYFRLNLLNEYINKYLEIYTSNDIVEILEIINKIGKIFKKEINYKKDYSKDDFIDISNAVESENFIIKFLGVLGEEYKKYGINSIIEKQSNDINLSEGIFKVLLSLYSLLPKYEIKINSETLKSNFLSEPKNWILFIDDLKEKISEKFSIPYENIYIISYRIDLLEFTIVILETPFINLKRYEKKFNIIVNCDTLLESVILSPKFFENEFNRDINDWEKINLERGGEKYFPPFGWKGLALKVLNKYDSGDNSWLGNEGKEGEWAIAYHGIGKGNEFKKLINILLYNLKKGPCQLYSNYENIRDDKMEEVGKGVYLTPDINIAENYANKIQLGERKSNFQFIIMCRVKPDMIRQPKGFTNNWVINDSYDCLRPYRLLIKET